MYAFSLEILRNNCRAITDPGVIVARAVQRRLEGYGSNSNVPRSLQKVNPDLFEAKESVSFVPQKLDAWRLWRRLGLMGKWR